MVIWEPRDSIQTRPLTDQNGATDQDGPTPLLNRTKAKEEEEEEEEVLDLEQWPSPNETATLNNVFCLQYDSDNLTFSVNSDSKIEWYPKKKRPKHINNIFFH